MSWILRISGHSSDGAEAIIARAQAAIDALEGAASGSISGDDGDGNSISASLLPSAPPTDVPAATGTGTEPAFVDTSTSAPTTADELATPATPTIDDPSDPGPVPGEDTPDPGDGVTSSSDVATLLHQASDLIARAAAIVAEL